MRYVLGATTLNFLAVGLLLVPRAAAAQPEVVRSRDGMVVSGSVIASEVGADVLARGGTAVDAAVATAFALSVVEPTMSGIGGRTQMLIRTPAGEYHGVDGTTEVPAGFRRGTLPIDDDGAYGWQTIAIPGTVAALAAALEWHGTWPLADVLAPAIRLAAEGFVLPADEAGRIANVADRLGEFEGSRRHFLRPDGTPLRAGDHFVQADLARVLRAVAENGPDAFYRGEIARRMAEDVQANGGSLMYEDLAGYRPLRAELARGEYRGHTLVGTYLPASGATTIQTMQILEHFDLGEVPAAEWVAWVAMALEAAFEDRAQDLASDAMGVREATSRERAWRIAERLRGVAAAAREPEPEPAFTTHLSVADPTAASSH